MIQPNRLLHYTLRTSFPELLPFLELYTEIELLDLPIDYFSLEPILDSSFRLFYEHILILREVDERIQNLVRLKHETERYQTVLRDLQRHLSR
jgi:hypothetical protein